MWVAALVLPPALLGLLFWSGGGGGRGARTAFVVLGYALGFCFIGRPNNDYWGLIIAPLWPLGLAEADRIIGRPDRPLPPPPSPDAGSPPARRPEAERVMPWPKRASRRTWACCKPLGRPQKSEGRRSHLRRPDVPVKLDARLARNA